MKYLVLLSFYCFVSSLTEIEQMGWTGRRGEKEGEGWRYNRDERKMEKRKEGERKIWKKNKKGHIKEQQDRWMERRREERREREKGQRKGRRGIEDV